MSEHTVEKTDYSKEPNVFKTVLIGGTSLAIALLIIWLASELGASKGSSLF